MSSFTDTELEAYLDEALPAERMAAIEAAVRADEALGPRLAAINARRDAGAHTLGDIWRRHRLSCPTREQLGSYLLGAMSEQAADYVKFHVDTIGCRWCQANLADLERQQAGQAHAAAASARRSKYFQSSAGYLGSRTIRGSK